MNITPFDEVKNISHLLSLGSGSVVVLTGRTLLQRTMQYHLRTSLKVFQYIFSLKTYLVCSFSNDVTVTVGYMIVYWL